ncbi:MAG: AraC family ligand binding domain-containing protein [Saprospiraceae bacterium]|nr:AraC family ligand binding domain-containing protein [Saprospiraceae bacterium]
MTKLPSYSICQLLGIDRCMSEIFVSRLRDFGESEECIQFPHKHEFFQLVLFTKGGGQHSIDFEQYEVKADQVYFTSPGQIHSWQFDDETDGFLVNFNESFFTSICHNPNFIHNFPLFGNSSTFSTLQLQGKVLIAVKGAFIQMLAEFENGDQYSMDMLRARLMSIIIQLSRILPEPVNDFASKHNVALMRKFESLIEEHYKKKRLPREYAELLFVTPNYLNTLSNRVLGKSAGEIIRERILLEAKRMLTNSDMMVGEIAETLHFEDNALFNPFLQEIYGRHPGRLPRFLYAGEYFAISAISFPNCIS